jgi:capsular polysaccharide biosynthesis protein
MLAGVGGLALILHTGIALSPIYENQVKILLSENKEDTQNQTPNTDKTISYT